MKSKKKQMLLAAMAVSAMTLQPMAAYAEEAASEGTAEKAETAELDSYTLDDVVVTATRTEKREVDIPEATEVVTAEDIKAQGAKNAADAIRNVNGIIYKSTGPLGSAMGTMTNEASLRGNDEGALVLVNGNPVSWRGKYNLQDIPADIIERIEVVKGGGSILYGSEAVSGVINIITKKDAPNSATVGFGNYGQQKYHINAGASGFVVSYDVNKWKSLIGLTSGDILDGKKNYGTYATDFSNIKNESINVSWKANDHLDFLYGHYETESDYDKYITSLTAAGKAKAPTAKVGDLFNHRTYQTIRDMVQVNYHDKNWRGSIYYNTGTVESFGTTNYSSKLAPDAPVYNTKEKNQTYGFDFQRNWSIGEKATLIAGLSGQHETYKALPTVTTTGTKVKSVKRNNWGAFANWEQRFDDKNSFTFGARETWTTGASKDQNYSNFSMAGQYLHKFDKDNSMYINISQSFIMPTFGQMYADGYQSKPNPDLKPQKGINYELGWKRASGKHLWKVALFRQNVKDKITASWDKGSGEWGYVNADFKNTGIELSCDIEGTNGFSYNYGVTWQNPMENLGEGSKKSYWDRKLGKVQLTGGVSYKKDKWHSAITATYLADRVQTGSSEHSFRTKPYLLTSLTVGYAPTELTEINLSIDNVLDRHDVLTHSSAAYYGPGINYMLSVTQKF